MKKTVIGILCAVVVSGCTVETVQPEVEQTELDEPAVIEKVVEFEPRNVEANYISIEANRLNVRSGADIDSEKVGAVFENEKYQVMEEKPDSQKRVWYKIKLADGTSGYVAGWFCAKTKITIHVEADEATIVDIDVQPIPRYVDNPFDEDDAKVGDQIVGLVIREIAEIDNLTKIVFKGEVELTGTYYHETSDLSFGRVVRFVPDEASSVLLPRIRQEVSSVAFILSDYDKVAGDFGEIGTEGYATITVDEYSIGYGVSNAYNQAKLIDVVIE